MPLSQLHISLTDFLHLYLTMSHLILNYFTKTLTILPLKSLAVHVILFFVPIILINLILDLNCAFSLDTLPLTKAINALLQMVAFLFPRMLFLMKQIFLIPP